MKVKKILGILFALLIITVIIYFSYSNYVKETVKEVKTNELEKQIQLQIDEMIKNTNAITDWDSYISIDKLTIEIQRYVDSLQGKPLLVSGLIKDVYEKNGKIFVFIEQYYAIEQIYFFAEIEPTLLDVLLKIKNLSITECNSIIRVDRIYNYNLNLVSNYDGDEDNIYSYIGVADNRVLICIGKMLQCYFPEQKNLEYTNDK